MFKTALITMAAASALAVAAFGPPARAQALGDAAVADAAVADADMSAAPAAPKGPAGGYCERRLGSWFYCETPKPPPAAQDPASAAKPGEPEEVAELAAYQKELEIASTVASWNPTPRNVEKFMRLQKIGLDKSSLFSDQWRRVIWGTPELDYTVQRPTMSLAKNEFDNERTSDRDLFLRGVSHDVGVFYVYSGTCGPCRVASPIIKAFADRYGVPVKVISTDGADNAVFGRTLADRGQLERWGISTKITPALLIFQAPTPEGRDGRPRQVVVGGPDGQRMVLRACEQANGCLTYLGAGVMSVEDIAERFFVLLSKAPGTDY